MSKLQAPTQVGPQTIPNSIVTAMVTGCKLGLTSKDSIPKWQIEVVIVAPKSIEFNGKTVTVEGRRGTLHQRIDHSENGIPALQSGLARGGFDLNEGDGFDTERPGDLVGKGFNIFISGKARHARYTVTDDEKAQGIREGKIMTDESGQPIILSYDLDFGIGMKNIVGPAPEGTIPVMPR
jgi:hypothetical protein